jgi:hypothetical protein
LAKRDEALGSATTAQLRDDIDSGRTRDKVPALDPAAAPLGTDDEAAGTPPPLDVVDRARWAETAERGEPGGATAAAGAPKDRGAMAPIIVAVVAIALAFAAVALLVG